MSNVSYRPEDFGLTIVAQADDPYAFYSFDTAILFKHTESGKFFYAEDSGCSCPSPFEWVRGTDDMEEVTSYGQLEELISNWNKPYRNGPEPETEMERHQFLMAAQEVPL